MVKKKDTKTQIMDGQKILERKKWLENYGITRIQTHINRMEQDTILCLLHSYLISRTVAGSNRI